jgi:hypothetical protein
MTMPHLLEAEREPGGAAQRTLGRMRRPSLPGRVARSGFLPTTLVVMLTVGVLSYYGVSAADIAKFGGYVTLGVTVPGTLWWRALRGRVETLAEDAAAGTALGYATEVLGYIAARAAGQPLLFLLWPIGTVVVFCSVPRLRRYWRCARPDARAPAGWAWAMAGIVSFLVLWSGLVFYRTHGLTWPSYAAPTPDQPYHLAMAGELKHHMQPVVPYLINEPLHYHWFVYAEMAATSWATGTELLVLINRLTLLPMLIAFTFLIGIIGRRVTGRWWGGVAAVAITYFAMAPDPYRWPLNFGYYTYGYGMVEDGRLLRMNLWISPTQTFGAVVFAAAALVLVDLFRGHARDVRHWVLLSVLLVTVMGGKSTYLPMLLTGLGLVIVVNLAVRRQWHRPALLASLITGCCLVFGEFVLFGGDNQGLVWAPTDTLKHSGVIVTTAWVSGLGHPAPLLLVAAMFVFSWVCIWPGLFGLLARPRKLPEDVVLTFLGVGTAGVGAVSLLGHPGLSQFYFFQSARPYLAVAAVCGVMAVLPPQCPPRKLAVTLLGGLAAGTCVVWVMRRIGSGFVPTLHNMGGERGLMSALSWPYLLLMDAAGLAGLIVVLAKRRLPHVGAMGAAFLMALVTGFGLLSGYDEVRYNVHEAQVKGWRNAPVATERPVMTVGTLVAARWLRDHSSPDDLIAANVHCRVRYAMSCDDRHFWISGFTERRVLIEGWGYTARANDVNLYTQSHLYLQFWDPRLLEENDAAFRTPNARTIGLLRAEYGVSWLFSDDPGKKQIRALDRFARLRFRDGNCFVYQVPPATGAVNPAVLGASAKRRAATSREGSAQPRRSRSARH